jgi:DNA-binding MltR family transcriptional regulator
MESEMDRLLAFSRSFDYEHDNDREIVIVGCAYIESLIKEILKAVFIDDSKEVSDLLSDSTGSLPSLLPRARLLYLLGVIPEPVYKDIKTVGKIRNEFAHKVSASFSDNRIQQLCRNLEWHEQSLFMTAPSGAAVRDIYQVGVNQLVSHLGVLPAFHRFKRESSFSVNDN